MNNQAISVTNKVYKRKKGGEKGKGKETDEINHEITEKQSSLRGNTARQLVVNKINFFKSSNNLDGT